MKGVYSYIFIFLLLLSCSKTERKSTTLLLDWWPNPNHIPIYVGIEEKIFEKHGIPLKIYKMSDSPEALSFLQAEKVDLALYYMPQTIRTSQKMGNLRVVAPYINSPLDVFLFLNEANISSVEDFNGKIMGESPDDLTVAYVNTMVKKANIEFSEIRKVNFDAIPALLSGFVQVVTGVYDSIEGEQLRYLGNEVSSLPVTDFGIPNYHELVIVSKESVLQRDPTLCQRFNAALQEAIAFSKEQPMRAFAIYAACNPNKVEQTLEWEFNAWQKTQSKFSTTGDAEVECWESFASWMKENDLIAEDTSLDALLKWVK